MNENITADAQNLSAASRRALKYTRGPGHPKPSVYSAPRTRTKTHWRVSAGVCATSTGTAGSIFGALKRIVPASFKGPRIFRRSGE